MHILDFDEMVGPRIVVVQNKDVAQDTVATATIRSLHYFAKAVMHVPAAAIACLVAAKHCSVAMHLVAGVYFG